LPDIPESVLLPRRSLALSLLQRVRDEAHRFAIEYHRKLRSKHLAFSELKKVKGIGDKKIAALYKAFSTFAALKSATVEKLSAVNGVSATDARAIREFFDGGEK
jgi:Nuclease subunit of the excinuclease complex